MGGQIGDHGVITGKNGAMTVSDVQKTKDGKYMHIGVVTEGELSVEDEVTASVDAAYRQAICRAHTSTHLLQKALRTVLGDHVEQAGSYTANDHIRFDFTHFAALTAEELAKVEDMVNDAILAGSPVITEEMSIDDAKKKGAMALFGEKYGQTVRVVQAGDSIELCGGTHLDNTAKAGSLKIIGEASVAAGVRRIEAVTGKAVLKLMNDRQAVLNEAAAALKTNPNELSAKIEQQVNDMRALNKKLEKMGAKVAAMQMVDLFNVSRNIKGVEVVATKLDDASADMLRTMGDDIKGKKDNMVAVLSAVNGDKVSLLCVCGAEAVKKGAHAGKIIKEVAKIVGVSVQINGQPQRVQLSDFLRISVCEDAELELSFSLSPRSVPAGGFFTAKRAQMTMQVDQILSKDADRKLGFLADRIYTERDQQCRAEILDLRP